MEAASAAWEPLGFSPVAFSELDNHASAFLSQKFPAVPNWGDMTKFGEWPDATIDLFVGGTPCQSFSVAGLRKGLRDPRGNLALTYLAIADRYRPRWLVWENVPGVLSSGEGRDFGSFLGGLGKLGYGFAYRVLDAQYYGVPQRRRRVFVVGYLGSWRRAAAVLFERESVPGDPPPRREAGQSVAGTLEARASTGGVDFGPHGAASGHLVAAYGGGKCSGPVEVAPTLEGHAPRSDYDTETFVASVTGDRTHALGTANGGKGSSEDGTGRGVPVVAFHNRQDPDISGAITHPLGAKDNGLAVAFSCKDYGPDASVIAPPLRAMGHAGSHANAGGQLAIASEYAVRRLTPTECLRLQGFPDDWFDGVTYRGKPLADGPKYKMIGNSMAVPVMRWIGERIQLVDGIEVEP